VVVAGWRAQLTSAFRGLNSQKSAVPRGSVADPPVSQGAKGEVLLCGTCMDARGMIEDEVTEGARRSSMSELTERTVEADQVLVF